MALDIRPFARPDTDQVVALWRATGLTRPWNDPYRDIERKLAVQPELFLVAVDDGVVVGSAMAGYDGHRGWLHYLAAAEDRRGEGIGRALISHAETALEALGCPKVQLMVRPGNEAALGFFYAVGYEDFDTQMFGKRLTTDGEGSADSAPVDEDDGYVIVSLTVFSDEPLDALVAFRSDHEGWRQHRYDLGTISFQELNGSVRAAAFDSTASTLLDLLHDVPDAVWDDDRADVRFYTTLHGRAHTMPRQLVRRLARVNATVWIDT